MSRLTEDRVIARAKESDLSMIKKFNCWGNELADVSIVKRMRGLEVLVLTINKITTLAHFEDCHKLQELYLRKNNIADINEIRYLQKLPALKNLWLEENPCCERAGPNYRAIVLRALPNLKKLDNVEVTQEELDEALSGGGGDGGSHEEAAHEDTFEQPQQQQQQQQPQQPQQQYHHQAARQSASPQSSQSKHNLRSSSSPIKESERPAHPVHYRHSQTDLTDWEEHQQHPIAPHSQYGSQLHQEQQYFHQAAPQNSHSMHKLRRNSCPISKSERPTYPVHYRHSQTDLTEWEEQQQHPIAPHNQYGSQLQFRRQSAGTERECGIDRYAYRNDNALETGDWFDANSERPRLRRSDRRFSDSASTANHYANKHRRPINHNSNLVSAMLCLVKDLDYSSLKIIQDAVCCRIDEFEAD